MNTLEHWVLRIADSNATWWGLNWLRPAKHQPVGLGYILLSSFVLGLPGIAVGAGMVYFVFGRVEPRLWLTFFVIVMIVELPLHLVFAHFWNRRASKLGNPL